MITELNNSVIMVHPRCGGWCARNSARVTRQAYVLLAEKR